MDASDAAHGRRLARWLHNHLPAVQVFGLAAGLMGSDPLPDLTAGRFDGVALPKVCRFQCTAPSARHACAA